MANEKKQPWDRITKVKDTDFEESLTAYEAFCTYRDMPTGERSQKGLLKLLGKSPSYIYNIERWSSRFNWVERTKAYYDYLDKQAQQVQEDKLVRRRLEQKEDEYTNSQLLKATGREILEDVKESGLRHTSDREYAGEGRHAKLVYQESYKPTELIIAAKAALEQHKKLGRSALGMAEETTRLETEDTTPPIEYDFSALTEGEVETFLGLLDKVTIKDLDSSF